jgi:hypothetical protein
MLDATAFDLAELTSFDNQTQAATSLAPSFCEGDWSTSAALAVAACAACHQAFGECAVVSARAGALSPVLAMAVCNSMQRLVERAYSANTLNPFAYWAYVLLGPSRTAERREEDLALLAETMR